MWHDPAVLLPPDGAAVYFRRLLYGGQTPVAGTYYVSDTAFACPNGLRLSWYFVAAWRLV